jgi:hypothetical protein
MKRWSLAEGAQRTRAPNGPPFFRETLDTCPTLEAICPSLQHGRTPYGHIRAVRR